MGDLDEDGNLDLAVANSGTEDVSVLLGNGDVTFARAVTFAGGDGTDELALGDLEGDGDLDLVIATRSADEVVVRLNSMRSASGSDATGEPTRAHRVARLKGGGRCGRCAMATQRTTSAAFAAAAVGLAVGALLVTGEQRASALGQSGACCLNNGICVIIATEAQCTGNGGVYQGAGTTCGGNCGACCLPGGNCTDDTSPGACEALLGQHQGPVTTCAGSECTADPLGACCLPTANCNFDTEAECTTAGGLWHGEGTVCGDFNQNGTDDVCETGCPCPTDVNGDGVTGVLDLLDMLSHWNEECP